MSVHAHPPGPTDPYLSVVVPVHNGEGFIEASIRMLLDTLEGLRRPFELIVVCDGGTAETARCARAVVDDRVRVLEHPVNAGKGHAIASGFAQARGRLVGWIDGDMDIDARALLDAAAALEREPIDGAIGSKRHPDSVVEYPWIRRVYSWGFQMIARVLLRVKVRDTQVGAKLFRREMIDTVGPLLLIKRYAFDLEVLAVGAEFGFDRIEEVPIRLNYRFSGSGINWHAVHQMFVDTLAIAYRIHIRHWYVRRFASLERHRMDEAAAAAGRPEAQLPTPDSDRGAQADADAEEALRGDPR